MANAVLISEDTYVNTRSFGFADHFCSKDTARWTTTATDSGTATIAAKRGGIIDIAASDGTATDNDEIYLFSAGVFKFEAKKALRCEIAYSLVEAGANASNVFIGLMSAPAADSILDNGGGLKASMSGAGFFKVDGQSVWSVVAADGTSKRTKVLNAQPAYPRRLDAINAASASVKVLRIDVVPTVGKKANITFYVDHEAVEEIKDFTFDNAAMMSLCIGLKAGSTDAQVLSVDYASCYQTV